MDLFRPKTLTGEWFPFGDGEILVRLIPADVDAAFLKNHYRDRTTADVAREGGDQLNLALTSAYILDRACYALVDSKNVWAPRDMVAQALPKELPPGAAQPEQREDGMLRLDGFWSDAVKKSVLKELLTHGLLGNYVQVCSRGLAAKVAARKEELGKG
jgi:hypothetical protein